MGQKWDVQGKLKSLVILIVCWFIINVGLKSSERCLLAVKCVTGPINSKATLQQVKGIVFSKEKERGSLYDNLVDTVLSSDVAVGELLHRCSPGTR